jgi:hypothetical protein
VAIASNCGGDLLFLLPDDTGEPLSEAIYFWDRETDEAKPVADAMDDLPS